MAGRNLKIISSYNHVVADLCQDFMEGNCEFFFSLVCACTRVKYRLIISMIGDTYGYEGTKVTGHYPELNGQI